MTIDHRVGTHFGDYLIEDVLGRGGMGVVYRAERAEDGRKVALKLMLPELVANEHFRERFIREAELMPTLDHPNIVPVYETGDRDGELFIAMHLVEGYDLKTLIAREGKLEPRQAFQILAQAGAALDAAHELGVVHRDVKPQNILISPGASPGERDLVFLTDFGLVRPAASESTSSRTGQIFGSIQYMSPEAIEGLPADGRADVYSLACVAYECLTGGIPFDRPNEIGVIWAHIHEDPPRVSDVRPELPAGLDDVVRHGMAKHPDDRYLTCGELISGLESGLQRRRRQLVPTPLRPLVKRIPRPKTEREIWAPNFFPELSRVRRLTNKTNWVQVTATVAILVMLAALFVQFSHSQGIPGAVDDVAESVGGAIADVGAVLTGDQEEADQPRSPMADRSRFEGARVADRDDVVTAAGAALLDRTEGRLDGRDEGRQGRKGTASVNLRPVAMSRTITFSSTRDGSYDIFAGTLGRRPRQLTSGVAVESHPAYSPDGSMIAFARSRADASAGTTADVGDTCVVGVGEPDPCLAGTHIWIMDSVGTNATQLTFGTKVRDSQPEWSPDGQSIVFTRWEEGRNADLYSLTRASDGEWIERRLTSLPGDETEAAFSPDGTLLTYSGTIDDDELDEREDEDSWDIYAIGRGGLRRLTKGADGWSPTWDPEGSRIVFNGRGGLWTVTPNGGVLRQLTRGADEFPDWSPDGTRVAFSRCEIFERCRILALHLSSGRVELLADDAGDFDGMVSWGPAI